MLAPQQLLAGRSRGSGRQFQRGLSTLRNLRGRVAWQDGSYRFVAGTVPNARDGLNKSVDRSSTHRKLSRAAGLFRVSLEERLGRFGYHIGTLIVLASAAVILLLPFGAIVLIASKVAPAIPKSVKGPFEIEMLIVLLDWLVFLIVVPFMAWLIFVRAPRTKRKIDQSFGELSDHWGKLSHGWEQLKEARAEMEGEIDDHSHQEES